MRMLRNWILLELLLLLGLRGIGMAAAIPSSEIKRVVAFVYVKKPDGSVIPNGTCFFVGIKHPSADKSAVYLVTAKHVLQDENGRLVGEVLVRVNRKSGGVETVPIRLVVSGEKQNVFVHQDTTVDIAVISTVPHPDKFDFLWLPEAEFVTTKDDFDKFKIREGSEVFFSGLFLPFPGVNRNYPVVRFGRVALITDEKVRWEGTDTELYLVETFSFGGNSGSPVFFYLGSDREPGSIIVGPPVLKLAGIMKGFFGEGTPVRFAQTTAVPVSVSNLGIAAVVPAYKLHEVLFSAALKNQRAF